MKTILILILMLPMAANADKIIVGALSKHYNNPYGDLNEVHQGIGLEKNGMEYALFKNSLRQTSLAITKLDYKWHYFGLDFGYRYGLASGYDSVILERWYNEDGEETTHVYSKEWKYGIKPVFLPLIQKEFKYLTMDLGLGETFVLTFKIPFLHSR